MIKSMEFKEIALEDKGWVRQLLSYENNMAAEYNFTVLYIWRDIMNSSISRYKDLFLLRFFPKGADSPFYLFPAGRGEEKDYREAMELYMEDAHSQGYPLRMASVQKYQLEMLQGFFPDKFMWEPARSSFDYIYSAEDLTFLRGKKFQNKRNFASRFRRQEGWRYEAIDEQNLPECARMSIKWCAKYGCGKNPSMESESCSVKNAIKNFFELELQGGLLRLNGTVVAFTIAEKTNSDTLLVHIEKAYADIPGAYPAIANEFLRNTIVEDEVSGKLAVAYINREDDAGDEGLREAKMQYHPLFLLEKYTVKEK